MNKLKKSCPVCKKRFTAKTSRKVYCSDRCRYWERDRRPERREYDRERHRKTYAEGAPVYDRPRFAKERAEFYGVEYEDFAPAEIFERDKWICGICENPVDKTLKYPDPHCASLDHIIPWSRGGAHTKTNVQCSHLECNLRKTSKLPHELASILSHA